MRQYTDQKIHSNIPKTILPHKCALILEGGGMRGFYSAGVMDALLEAKIMFPYVIGVSAGAANAVSYVSGQKGRNKSIIENYVSDPRYIGLRNIFTDRSILGFDFIFREVPQKHSFFDWQAFHNSKTRFLTGAFDCRAGTTLWFDKEKLNEDGKENLDILKASCSIPFVAPIVHYHDKELLDGGILDAIAIHQSIADGNDFHVIVLTRNAGYRKTPKQVSIAKFFYKKYPKLIHALKNRHTNYNAQLELCEELERQGKAIIIRPNNTLKVDRINTDKEKLLTLYQEGFDEAQSVIQTLYSKFFYEFSL